MALAMTRPWKHPRTGIYWLRRAVPKDLRDHVGKREEKRSLETRDPDEARQRHAQALVALDQRWANLRSKPAKLTEREAHEMAVVLHDDWFDRHRDEPSAQTFWRIDIGAQVFASTTCQDSGSRMLGPTTVGGIIYAPAPSDLEHKRGSLLDFDSDMFTVKSLERWCRDYADHRLNQLGLIVDEESRFKFAKAIAAAVHQASLRLSHHARGDVTSAHFLRNDRSPAPEANRKSARVVRFDELVEGWKAEKQPALKTIYEWSRVVRQFVTFLGRDDATSVTPDDLIAWKERMIADGARPKTIRDAKLAPIRAIMQWGVDNRRLAENPAARVSMDVKAKAAESIRSFTDQEAALILRAAQAEKDAVLRWVPWLCAYSGARVSEVCQLRTRDIVQVHEIWCMRFDPDAGPLKTASSERAVPLHDAVLEEGFLRFVRSVGDGPLFPRLKPDAFGKRGGNGTKVLGRWVRKLGLTDERLAPNHSWRHRLKTLGRRHGLAGDMVNAITGHGRRTVADSYGEFEMAALYRELMKVPAVNLK